MDYDVESSILTLHKGNGETVQAEVSVVTPTYSYGIMVYGVMLNNNSDKIYTKADKTLLMQYNSDKNIKVGIVMYAIATTSVISDRVGPFNVKISYGSQSGTFKVANIKYDQCITDSSSGEIIGVKIDPEEIIDSIAWVDISQLFQKSQQEKKITAQVVDDPNIEHTLELKITTEVITLEYNGDKVLSNNLVSFSLKGGSAGNYSLMGFNNGNTISESKSLVYSGLTPGLNQLIVRAVNESDKTIYTDYLYVDVIYTEGCEDTVVAVNEVSGEIQNN